MKLRIHHFFDIIRDFGSGKKIEAHPFGHAYHMVAELILTDADTKWQLVVASDETCTGCSHLINGVCDDEITHRNDISSKEAFNNHLDTRIMSACGFEESEKYSPTELCRLAHKYLANIEFVYEGNDLAHTKVRKQNVLKGLLFYASKHEFRLDY